MIPSAGGMNADVRTVEERSPLASAPLHSHSPAAVMQPACYETYTGKHEPADHLERSVNAGTHTL